MSNITIVMYHYVRDLKNSKYPKIKGLDISFFKEEILNFSSTNSTRLLDFFFKELLL